MEGLSVLIGEVSDNDGGEHFIAISKRMFTYLGCMEGVSALKREGRGDTRGGRFIAIYISMYVQM